MAKSYNFKAVATDDEGATGTSATVGVTVGPVTNVSPKVALAVSPTTSRPRGRWRSRQRASDDDGTIAKVAFYQGVTKIGEATSPPYTGVVHDAEMMAGMVLQVHRRLGDRQRRRDRSSAEIGATVGAVNAAPKVTVDERRRRTRACPGR